MHRIVKATYNKFVLIQFYFNAMNKANNQSREG